MSEPGKLLRTIFSHAVELADAGQRADYLALVCRDNEALRAQVEALIGAHLAAGRFLGPAGDTFPSGAATGQSGSNAGEPREKIGPDNYFVADTGRVHSTGQPGDHIGRYKLLQQIGEGGCGVVFMAEQEQPMRRRVALKVIKLGMDTKSVIARFEAERQALALMDHPNIAKVLDAGATDAGRPYFVMELVKGVRITDYCDQNNLPTAARLDLFMRVCQAIQHAHQKGIIHRDIKPSNILVTLHDGVPVPKVIDFGIAKATSDQRLTDKTLFTAFEQFMGTPAYMSPEQAEMSGLDIDTRSDIYALGVLLYELLTGKTPFDGKELLAAGLDEMRRTIREQEPARPSTRLSTMLAVDLTTVAKHRQCEATKLSSAMRGDLDWIVMRALEKDRTRRYDTANSLAHDIARHLNNEAVVARPPGNIYRFDKLVRRNKLAVAAGGAVATALIVGLVASTFLYFRQREARQRAEAASQKSQQVAEFLKDMLGAVGPSKALGRDTTMLRDILDKTAERVGRDLKNQPAVEAELQSTIGVAYDDLGEYAKAKAMHQAALVLRRRLFQEPHADVAASLNNLALVLWEEGDLSGAEAMNREALVMRKKLFGEINADVATSLYNLARVLEVRGDLTTAEELDREALAMRKKLFGETHRDVAISMNGLASVLRGRGDLPAAKQLLIETLAVKKKLFQEPHPEIAISLAHLGGVLGLGGELAEAEEKYRQALEMWRKLFGETHPSIAEFKFNLARVLLARGKAVEAETMHREVLAMRKRLLGDEHPQVARSLQAVGIALERQGKLAEAELIVRDALLMRQKLLGDSHPDVTESLTSLGALLMNQHKLAEAEPLLLKTYESFQQNEKVQTKYKRNALALLVRLYKAWDKPELAAEWKQKLEIFDKAEAERKSADKTQTQEQ